ncbi:MAG TPA: hypothetical protein PKV95_00390 [Anaerolineaceae bacterium]|mgnify:FL=1|nr:hypothetical protein [Anaerolineaceae bacterium]
MPARRFSLLVYLILACVIVSCTQSPTPEPPPIPTPIQIVLTADRMDLESGDCTWIHWEVNGGFDVLLDGEAVSKTGEREICPAETHIYQLVVDLGTSMETRSLEIIVSQAKPGGEAAAETPTVGKPTATTVAFVSSGSPAYLAEEWVKLGGPAGGLGYDIRMDPINPDVMYVTDSFAGIIKSTDGGKTWVPSNTGIEPMPGPVWRVFSATIDPFDHNTIWIGTQDTGEIYRSADGGTTWELRDTGLLTTDGIRSVRGITIDPNDRNVMYAGVEVTVNTWSDGTSGFIQRRLGGPTGGEVYKSVDAGASWKLIWQGLSLARYIWVDPRNSDRLYVSTGIFDRDAVNSNVPAGIWGGVGILRSNDGGETWTVLDEQNGLGGLYIPSLFMHPEDPDILLAAVTTPCDPDKAGVYITRDGGDTWQQILVQTGGMSMDAVEISVSNPQIWYAATESQIFRSEDAGATWQQYFMGSPERKSGMPIDLQVDPRDPYRIFVNNYGGGNFVSEDGGETWQDASQGYSGAIVTSIAVAPGGGADLIVGADTATFRSNDGGISWQGVDVEMAPAVLIKSGEGVPGYTIYTTTAEQGNINISIDGGVTWTMTRVIPLGAVHQEMRALAVAPSNPQVIFTGFMIGGCPGMQETIYGPACDAAASGLFRSRDGGVTWTKLTGAPFDQTNVLSVAIHPEDDQDVFAATARGLYQSNDQGETWQKVESLTSTAISSLGPFGNDYTVRGDIEVFDIVFDPANPSTLFAATAPGILFRSDDGGTTWKQSISGLQPNDYVFDILPDSNRPGVFYIGTTFSGVLYTTDGGDTWLPTGGGTGYTNLRALALSEDGSVLYAGTRRSGVWRLFTPALP